MHRKHTLGLVALLVRSGTLLLLLLFLSTTLSAQSSAIEREVEQAKTQQLSFQQVDLFQPDAKPQLPAKFQDELRDFADYRLLLPEANAIQALKSSAADAITMALPNPAGGEDIELELVRFTVFSPEFEAREMPSGRLIDDFDKGIYYRGVIKGEEGSLVAISIVGDEVSGLITRRKTSDNLVLGKLKDSPRHVIYNDRDVVFADNFECGALPSDKLDNGTQHIPGQSQAKVDGCFGIFFDIGNSIYNSKGGSSGAINYLQNIFAQVAILYANEEISVTISGTNVWTSSEPSNWLSNLANYRNYRNSNPVNGSLVHYVHTQQTAGVAYVDALCGSYRYGMSGITNSYSNVPTYSWTVMVITHELGHNFGSPHTHDCAWNGNNTAIDGCGTAAGYGTGCDGPIPNNGGTIMSYCHLTSAGINLNLGFGTQPGDLVRNRASSASCSNYSCGAPTCTDGIQNGDETGVDCGGPDCPACPTCDDGIQNGNETGVDCGGPDCAPCPCNGTEVVVSITLDNYPEETRWEIRDAGNSIIASSGTYGSQPDGSTVQEILCLADGCFDFIIYDSYGDGICCGYGNGSYSVTADGSTVASGGSFGSSETTNFCLGGGPTPSCDDGIQNGNETGVDCGGPDCPACPTCDDGVQNGNETGVDCGGPDCPACPTCDDGIQNGNETGVDCGGPDCAPCGGGGCTYGDVDFEDFNNWGIWNDGGSDCRRNSRDAQYAYSGNYCVRLRDNTSTSTTTTDNLNLTAYEEITVDWVFYPRSMENGEDFWLQISTNGGSSYTTVAAYAAGTSFENGNFYSATVVIPGPFSSNTRLRFRCDASGNSDYIYLDDVNITGCSGASAPAATIANTEGSENNSSIGESEVLETVAADAQLKLFPNPTQGNLSISFTLDDEVRGEGASLFLIDMNGRVVSRYAVAAEPGEQQLQIDVTDQPAGMYYIRLNTEGQQYIERFVLLK